MTESAGRERRPLVRRRRPVPWAVSDVVEIINIAPYDAEQTLPRQRGGFEYTTAHTGSGSRTRRRPSGPEIVIERVWQKPKSKSKTSKDREENTHVPSKETRYVEETTYDGIEKETTIVKETAYINPTITLAGTGDKKLGVKAKQKEVKINAIIATAGPDQEIAVKKGTSGRMWAERWTTRPKIFPVVDPPTLSPPASEDS